MKTHVVIFLLVFCGLGNVYAFEPIPITVSGTMDEIIFDGKWTHQFEWKESSLNTYSYYDNTQQVILRSAHQGDFVYIFLDPITDYQLDKMNDYAIICFDTENNKSTKADADDYCFMTYLDGKDALAFQGGDDTTETGFTEITNPEGFIAMSTVSDSNDRYTPIPHPSYEFRIPTDLIGRESVYGFYFLVYDGNSEKPYAYPQNLEIGNFVSSPSQWGEIYSPDKSLPEFNLPLLSLVLSILSVVFFSRIKNRIPSTASK